MDVDDSYEGEDFHPSFEPMVIINSQDEDEDEFFSHLRLRRICALSAQISQTSLRRFIRKEVAFKSDPLDSDGTNHKSDMLGNIGPEVTLIPVKKKAKPTFKIRLFEKKASNGHKIDSDYEEDDQETQVVTHSRSPGTRTQVRLVSREEALNAEEPYAKRKSSPLEKCPICKKYFRRMKTHLIKHEIQQNQEACAGLICTVCQKVFNNQSNLHIHMRTHTGDKPYNCEVCNKSFSQSCNLVNHMRIHTGEKPFKCPHCDRAFTQSGNLNNHIRLHTDEKPFKCHFCDKAFVQSGNLNSHIRNNHKLKQPYGLPREVTIS